MYKVVHCKKEKYDVYIGRPSKWGNPFTIGFNGSRENVIQLYKKWITTGEGKYLLKDLHELKGKTLGCWCAPQDCHGDVLVKLANRECKDCESYEETALCDGCAFGEDNFILK